MIKAIFAPFPLPFILLSHSPVILIITVREMIQNSIKTEPLIYLSFYDTEMPPHSPLCGGSSEKNAAHRSCNSEAALNLISETIGSQNNFNSCPLSSQSVQGNICFTKSAGSVQYLLHPPCGVIILITNKTVDKKSSHNPYMQDYARFFVQFLIGS